MGILSRLVDWAFSPRAPQITPLPAPLPIPVVAIGAVTAAPDFTQLAQRADRMRALLRQVINPTLAELAKRGIASDDRVRVMLLAIAAQESDIRHRDQVDAKGDHLGPALGLWQFERGGGVKGVLTHTRSRQVAANLCAAHNVTATEDAAWRALKGNDQLACAFARLLLWTDWRPLPSVQGDSRDGWDIYLRSWRPGKPHPDTWPNHWRAAVDAVTSER